ncbi:MAG: argininosuccinate lyase [Candidatus Omnitrophota bacterium]
MSKKLWGGRFGKKTDPLVEDFTKSIDYDYKLAKYDIGGSIIHVDILQKSDFITPTEAKALKSALNKIREQIRKDKDGKFHYDEKFEDIHTNIQNVLEKEVGDLVLKLHTARSRNDQVLFDLKAFCKFELKNIATLCKKLQQSLMESSEENKGIIIPGYTHLQHAQLVYLYEYLNSYTEMLQRDVVRLTNVSKSIKLSLGAGALSGTPIDPGIYNKAIKQFMKEYKEFAETWDIEQDITVPKALDTISNRDFVIETLAALAILGMHLSRFAEELIIWSTKEFGFIEIDDAFATGSSLMPQKKNPDVLELIRGYTGTLYGNLISALTMMKGLPLTYNRDMQLDKPPLFSSFEIIEKELKILPKFIKTLKWNKKTIEDKIKDDETLYATDLVYYLIKKGIPFKSAHDIIGKLVKFSLETDRKIKDMKDQELKKFSDKLKHNEVIRLMDPVTSVESRVSVDRSKQKLNP